MRKFAIGLVSLALALPLAPTELRAQTSSSVVVAVCGTPPTTYVAGHPYPNTQDTTGTQCTKAAGGITNATIVGPLGRQADAASVSNALSTEDIAILTGVSPSTANPCASTITVGCTLAAELQLLTNTAAQSVPCQALSAEQTKATTGNPIATACDLVGKLVTSPYANRENMVRGGHTETGTSPGTILAASGSSPALKGYLTDITCWNSSATADTITLSDSAATVLLNPAGGGYSHSYLVPLVSTSTNTAIMWTATTGETTEGCWGSGFYGY